MIRLRAALAILLLFGVYVLVLLGIALSGALLVLGVMAIQSYVDGETTTFNATIVFAVGGSIATIAALISAVFTVKEVATDTSSVLVHEKDAPELWAFVEEVAAEAGIRPPDELLLNGQVNASVSEDSRLLGLLPGRRRLHLGVPLLAELSANELRALLGHEFGHYIGRHTRVGAVVYRGFVALDRIQDKLEQSHLMWGPSGWLRLFFGLYTRLYANISFAVRRRQEFEADAVAARIAGPEAVARALRSLAAIEANWQLFRQHYLVRTADTGYAPEDPVGMFATMLADPQRRKAIDLLKAEDPQPEKRNRYASHPSMADRLARLAEMRADVPARLPEPTPSTWTYPGRKLLRHLLRRYDVEALPAAQWLDKAARVAAPTAAARLLLDATGPDASLETVLDTLEAGEAGRLAGRFDAEDPHRAMARLCEALHGLVGHYLVEAGSAHWRLSWNGPSDLVVSELRADGVHVLPFAEINSLVFDAVDHRSGVDRLRLHLASLRVDPRRPYVSGAAQTTRVAVDPEPKRRERARMYRMLAFTSVLAVAVIAVMVAGATSPKPPLVPYSTYTPTFGLPTTTFRYFPTGEQLPSFPLPTLPSYDFTVTGPITVQPGDTLDELARCYRTTVGDLQQLNGLGTGTDLQAGQTLLVPNAILACHR